MSSRSRGFSLIEVMIAALVLSASLGVIFQALGVGQRGTARIEDEIQATNLAQDLIDWMASLPFSRLPLKAEDRSVIEVPPTTLVDAMPADTPRALLDAVKDKIAGLDLPPNFAMLLSIEEPEGSRGELKKLTVKVSWTHDVGQGQQQIRDIRLTTLVARGTELDL